jgi:hypothetical protein
MKGAALAAQMPASSPPKAPAQVSTRIRLELKPGDFVLRHEKLGKSRMTALGLAVRKAWNELPKEFAGLAAGDLTLRPLSLEGVLHFNPKIEKSPLAEVVMRFKLLCQERFALLKEEPSDLWVPGFIESSENLA